MKEGDVILTPLAQADGIAKNRPALLLRELPPFGDFLVCGISSQLYQAVPEFDEIIVRGDGDFASSGLLADSVFRPGFFDSVASQQNPGFDRGNRAERHRRLLRNLSEHLVAKLGKRPTLETDSGVQ